MPNLAFLRMLERNLAAINRKSNPYVCCLFSNLSGFIRLLVARLGNRSGQEAELKLNPFQLLLAQLARCNFPRLDSTARVDTDEESTFRKCANERLLRWMKQSLEPWADPGILRCNGTTTAQLTHTPHILVSRRRFEILSVSQMEPDAKGGQCTLTTCGPLFPRSIGDKASMHLLPLAYMFDLAAAPDLESVSFNHD